MAKFKILSFNAQGFSDAKAHLLGNLQADVLCLQETHRTQSVPKVPGMHPVINIPSAIYGSTILARDKSIVQSTTNLSTGANSG